jgi:hypothetical protein
MLIIEPVLNHEARQNIDSREVEGRFAHRLLDSHAAESAVSSLNP